MFIDDKGIDHDLRYLKSFLAMDKGNGNKKV